MEVLQPKMLQHLKLKRHGCHRIGIKVKTLFNKRETERSHESKSPWQHRWEVLKVLLGGRNEIFDPSLTLLSSFIVTYLYAICSILYQLWLFSKFLKLKLISEDIFSIIFGICGWKCHWRRINVCPQLPIMTLRTKLKSSYHRMDKNHYGKSNRGFSALFPPTVTQLQSDSTCNQRSFPRGCTMSFLLEWLKPHWSH